MVVGVAMTLLVIVWRPHNGDPFPVYGLADKAANGLVPYRDYPVEYPPLGLVYSALPRLIGGTSHDAYQNLFSILSIVAAIATGLAVFWLARRRWSVDNPTNVALMFTGLALAGAPLVVWRFDILPALLTVLALVAYAARRPGWTGLALGLGVVAKLYPFLLGPVFAAAQIFERRWRDLALLIVGGGAAVVAVLGETYLVAGSGAFSFLDYQRDRGVETESIAGGIAMLAGALKLSPTQRSFQFGSDQVTSPFLTSIGPIIIAFEVLVVVALVTAVVVSFRRDVGESGSVQPLTIVQYSLAALLAVILTNKVLSPQYIVWLLPFVPLSGPRKSLLFLAIVVMTILEYPLGWDQYANMELPVVLLLNARNALLVVLFGWVVLGSERGYVRESAD